MKKDGYINFLRLECKKIAISTRTYSSEWHRVHIADIVKGNNEDNILQHLAIELPLSYVTDNINLFFKFIEEVMECLTQSVKTGYRSKNATLFMDTRTSIIYLMRCKRKNCKRDLYIGRTHVGKIRRHEEHTEYDTNSAVYQHINENKGHGFNIKDMEILEVCCDSNKLQFLEALYIKEYLLNGKILKGRDGILNKNKGVALSIFEYTNDDENRVREYLNRRNNAGEAGVLMEGGGQDTYKLHRYISENDNSEYDEEETECNRICVIS